MLLLITGAFFSCKKQEGNIVIDGQGNGSQLQLFTNDTLKLEAVTIKDDSVLGSGLPYAMLGAMSDPLLGKTAACIFAAISLQEPITDFPNTLTPDSAILYFPIIDGLNFYGDKISNQKLTVRFLGETIDATKSYYQNFNPALDLSTETPWMGSLFSTKFDSIGYKKTKLELHPGVKIKLSASMAKYLMQMPKEAYQSNTGLATSLKGIAIIPQDQDLSNGKGGIGVYDFHNQLSTGYMAKILLYYRDTETFLFSFAGKTRTVTTGRTGPFPSEVQTQLLQPSATFNKTYVQSLQGVKTYIHFPNLLNTLNGNPNNVAINKAELTLAIDKGAFTADFAAPPRLNLFRPKNNASKINNLLPDAAYSTFGGIYNETEGTYTFIITRYVQEILNQKFNRNTDGNYGLFLAVPTAAPVLAARALADFGNSKTKLKITYTRIN